MHDITTCEDVDEMTFYECTEGAHGCRFEKKKLNVLSMCKIVHYKYVRRPKTCILPQVLSKLHHGCRQAIIRPAPITYLKNQPRTE